MEVTRYFTGKTCLRGHIASRQTCSGSCTECAKLKTQQWREENPEKDAESRRKSLRKWVERHPEQHRENCKSHREKNIERHRERGRISSKKRRLLKPDEMRATQRRADAKRRAAKLGCVDHYTVADVDRILMLQGQRCPECCADISDRSSRHIDHIMPLSKGGSNGPENIQILCKPCNLQKQAIDPYDFARRKGRLL